MLGRWEWEEPLPSLSMQVTCKICAGKASSKEEWSSSWFIIICTGSAQIFHGQQIIHSTVVIVSAASEYTYCLGGSAWHRHDVESNWWLPQVCCRSMWSWLWEVSAKARLCSLLFKCTPGVRGAVTEDWHLHSLDVPFSHWELLEDL